MSKKDEKITKLGYDIEAMTDEVEHLHEVISGKQARIAELIGLNDRLTLTYEPYRPPGDDYENVAYYDLIEENDSLTKNVVDKIEVIRGLDEEIVHLRAMVKEFQAEASQLDKILKAEKRKNNRKYAGCLSFDFWPISDWFRLNLYRWNPGKAFQLCIGPIRLDFFEA